jgi:hypothetical protein
VAGVPIADGSAAPSCQSAFKRRIRRLSSREYLNLITDIFGREQAERLAPILPLELNHAGFDNQDDALLVSPVFQEALAALADKLSSTIEPDQLAPCADSNDPSQCLDDFARGLTRKAYGRPAEEDEVARVLAVAALGEDYADSVRLIVELVMQSPNTLYATELGPLDAELSSEPVALTQHELANQLSLIVTASRPDQALSEAADQGRLSDPQARTDEVVRLLASERARVQLRKFVTGWLDMGPISEVPKNVDLFPAFSSDLAAAMQEELDAFIDDQLAAGYGDFSRLLSETSTHIPSQLLSIYEHDLLPGTDTVQLDPARRRGVLSLPAVLTYHSSERHSGPIDRGLLVRRQLLCQEVAPPPASVAQAIAAAPTMVDDVHTTRQSFEAHVNDAFCQGCHSQFDPIGFGLEEMDALGRSRTLENNLPVDTHGELTGTDVDGPFAGVAELSLKLSASEDVRSCLARHFFRFVASRSPEPEELCLAEDWSGRFLANEQHLSELFFAYVESDAFALRVEAPGSARKQDEDDR